MPHPPDDQLLIRFCGFKLRATGRRGVAAGAIVALVAIPLVALGAYAVL